MQRLTISAHFRGEATPPAGEPPQVDVKSSSESVDVRAVASEVPGGDDVPHAQPQQESLDNSELDVRERGVRRGKILGDGVGSARAVTAAERPIQQVRFTYLISDFIV